MTWSCCCSKGYKSLKFTYSFIHSESKRSVQRGSAMYITLSLLAASLFQTTVAVQGKLVTSHACLSHRFYYIVLMCIKCFQGVRLSLIYPKKGGLVFLSCDTHDMNHM